MSSEAFRARWAGVIARRGFCEGCGGKVKRRLAMRHVLSCSMAHMNHEEPSPPPLPPSESLLLPTERG